MERKREFFAFMGLGVSDRKLAETLSNSGHNANRTIEAFVGLLSRYAEEHRRGSALFAFKEKQTDRFNPNASKAC